MNFTQSYSNLGGSFVQQVSQQSLDNCKQVHVNQSLAKQLGIATNFDYTQLLDAEQYPAYASVYSGHQFGIWAGQLGDGRACTLGDLASPSLRNMEVQLKGAGQTPYSRFADGRAVLRSSIREYLASEALYQLNIASTRALALIVSDTDVNRESVEKAAVVVRCAHTHIRFGHFEHFFYNKRHDELRQLANFVWQQFYPECENLDQVFEQIVLRTAKLVAMWQVYGFCHGVLNTDNMSIIGDTLDYGPYGFMDAYNSNWICNHSDHQGRYSYKNQPSIGLWNCNALAHAFSALIEVDSIKASLSRYEPYYWDNYHQFIANRIGIESPSEQTKTLTEQLLSEMALSRFDFNNSFLVLKNIQSNPQQIIDFGISKQWVDDYRQLITSNKNYQQAHHSLHNRANPQFILRNYMAQQAISDAENLQYETLNHLFRVIQQPFEPHSEVEHWQQEPPLWAKQLELSCSS